MAQEKEYFAFISYQRKDEEWADRLRSKLEHYRLPSSVRKQDTSLPKEIRPIFRDALELAGGVLAKEIETALQSSKYLIVICSPNSAKSPWVNKEIQTFIDLGREDRIIPFIIDGTPFSDNEETECFPPALRSLKGEKELLGININELSRDAASIKVIARMFGLKFDILWQRYEREKKRKRWMIIGGALLLAFVSLGIGAYIAHQNQELDARNKEVAAERDRANSERDRANSERDKAETANASLRLANDSIKKQYAIIEKQKNEIATERDNAKNANYALQVNLSRILAEKSISLVDEGDAYLACLMALHALPPCRPYTEEAEVALRMASLRKSAILRGHTSRINHFSFTHDGKYIITTSEDFTIRKWDLKTGRQIGQAYKVPYHIENISPDCQYYASTSSENGIRIFKTSTNKLMTQSSGGHSNMVSSLVFSPNGKYIVSTSEDCIRIWDSTTGRQIGKTLNGHTDRVLSVAFSLDGKYVVSTSWDKTIRIWDSTTGCQIGQTLEGHTDGVLSAAFSPDGKRIVSASRDKTIRIWDAGTYQQIGLPFEGHSSWVSSVVFSPDGKLIASASKDKTIRIWDSSTGRQIVPSLNNLAEVSCLSFTPDSKNVVAAVDNTIRIFDISQEKQLKPSLELYSPKTNLAIYSPDGEIITSRTEDGNIDIWNAHTGKHMFKLDGHMKKDAFPSFCPNSQYIASVTEDNEICVWDINTGKQIGMLLEEHNRDVSTIGFSPDKEHLVSTSYNKISIWNLANNKIERIIEGNLGDVFLSDFSKDGMHFITCSINGEIRIWNITSGRQIGQTIRGHSNIVIYANFSSDDKELISASYDGTVKKWDATTGKQIGTPLRGHASIIWEIEISKNGNYLATASMDNAIRIWDVATGRLIFSTTEDSGSNYHFISFNADGKYVLLTTLNGTFELWNVITGKQIFRVSDNAITATFSPDGKHILSRSKDGTIKIYGFIPLQQLIDETYERFKNNPLTPEERRKYYID